MIIENLYNNLYVYTSTANIMPQSYARIILHTTFSTKYRLPLIDPDIESRLHAVLAGELKTLGATVLSVGGVSDHVHIVHSLPRDRSLAELMQKAKAVSSRWVKTMGKEYASFAWQDGYASFSADYRSLNGLLSYVANQHEHHGMAGKGMTYEQEYIKLLEAYGFEDYKTKYLFPVLPTSIPSEPFKR